MSSYLQAIVTFISHQLWVLTLSSTQFLLPIQIIRDVNLTINKLPLVFASRQRFTVMQWRIQYKARIHILSDLTKIDIPSNAFDNGKVRVSIFHVILRENLDFQDSSSFQFWILVRFESRASEETSPIQIKQALESSLVESDRSELERMKKTSEELRLLVVVLFLTMLSTLAAVLVLLRTRRRRPVCAPVWIPPMEDDLKSKLQCSF